jgi:drug/metabolite transporter (DMT)-like permease
VETEAFAFLGDEERLVPRLPQRLDCWSVQRQPRPEAVTGDSIVALVYLTAVGSLVAFTAFAWVLRQAPLPLIATYAFVNPVVAVFLGALILHEAVTPTQGVAGAVIVIGVALLILSRNRMSTPRPVARPIADSDDAAAAA